MPQLVRNIDQYFTEKKRDLFLLCFSQKKSKESKLARSAILSWLKKNCPNILVEPIFPIRNNSGYDVLPWDYSHSIDFDETSLQLFIDEWEDSEGNSNNPFFQCYLIKYKKDNG